MKFIEVNCKSRETTININIDHIVILKRMLIAGSSNKEVCEIVLTSTNDNKGPVLVIKTVEEVKKLITKAKE